MAANWSVRVVSMDWKMRNISVHWARNGTPIVFDVQRAMLNCRAGTLRKTGCSFARMIIGPNLASRVNSVDRLVT